MSEMRDDLEAAFEEIEEQETGGPEEDTEEPVGDTPEEIGGDGGEDAEETPDVDVEGEGSLLDP